MSATGAAVSAHAAASGFEANASTSFGSFPSVNRIQIAGSVDWDGGTVNSGEFSGSAVVTFNASHHFTSSFSWGNTNGSGVGSLTIKNPSNATIYSASGGSQSGILDVVPGAYTFTWSGSGGTVASTGGSAGMTFVLVPEPASLSLLTLGVPLARRRRPVG